MVELDILQRLIKLNTLIGPLKEAKASSDKWQSNRASAEQLITQAIFFNLSRPHGLGLENIAPDRVN